MAKSDARRRSLRQSRKSTAYHEAGHAVIGRVLTLPCGMATIKPDHVEETAGLTITAEPYACLHEWEKRGKVPDFPDEVFHARIMTYMAGAEAEAVLLDRIAVGDADDRKQIALMAEELCYSPPWEKLEPRLRGMTRMLVRRHRARVERVVKALLAETTLNGEQLDKLVGRSVEDVKVNAPYLLAMNEWHRLSKGLLPQPHEHK